MSTKGVDRLSPECAVTWSAYIVDLFGDTVSAYAGALQRDQCAFFTPMPTKSNFAAISLLMAIESEYIAKGPAAAENVEAHKAAEKLLKRANAVESNLQAHPGVKSAAGKHLSVAIAQAKLAMGKVIEAHNALHKAATPAGPTFKEHRPWVCKADSAISESTVHFDKPCDSFVSTASSVGGGVANRFGGVFILDESKTKLGGECKRELEPEAAFRFGQSLKDARFEMTKCANMRPLSRKVLTASTGLRDATEEAQGGLRQQRSLGDSVEGMEDSGAEDDDLDAKIAAERKEVQDIVENAKKVALEAHSQVGEATDKFHGDHKMLKVKADALQKTAAAIGAASAANKHMRAAGHGLMIPASEVENAGAFENIGDEQAEVQSLQ
jgi:hypothetical protein